MKRPLLSKLSLVIPSYDRPSFALRSMGYWSGQGVAVHIIDGSPRPISPSDLDGFAENIHYHYLPASYVKRLEASFGYLDTEYVALAGDDEFFIPSGLEACIAELDRQPELVSCMGRCLRFDNTVEGVRGNADYLAMENYSILQSDPIERMLAHMHPYTCSTVYSVVRTPVWRRAVSTYVRKEFPVYAIGELQIELAICYQGKSRVLPELTWLRSSEVSPTRGTDVSLAPANTFAKWWSDPAMNAEHAEFLAIMGATLAEGTAVAAEIEAGVKRALDAYHAYGQALSSRRRTGAVQQFKARAAKHLPGPLKALARKALDPFMKSRRHAPRPIMEAASELAATGVRVDLEEVARIASVVSAFHAKAKPAPRPQT
jgi:glycosyltransferase domain-containing protein